MHMSEFAIGQSVNWGSAHSEASHGRKPWKGSVKYWVLQRSAPIQKDIAIALDSLLCNRLNTAHPLIQWHTHKIHNTCT
jgi:hypothetical protein